MKDSYSPRVLAIEARRSRIGYALFEGPNKLLDWGASTVPANIVGRNAAKAARKRIVSVLRRSAPSAIVVKRPRRTKMGLTVTAGRLLRAIVLEARTSGIPLYFTNLNEIRASLLTLNARTKDEIASMLVSIFPELIVRLPPIRKKWQPEHRGMIVFDAIATGLAYQLRNLGADEPPD